MPKAVADGSDSRGQWLRERPFAVRVGPWFFSHAGDTHGRSVADLEQALRAAVDTHDYDDPEIVGADSILESKDWFADDSSMGLRYAHAVDCLACPKAGVNLPEGWKDAPVELR
jgi:hypothetical protein